MLIGLAIFVVALIGLGAIFVAFSGQEATFTPGSPEAAFQAYARAWEDGDLDTARAAMTESARATVPMRALEDQQLWSEEETARLWIDEVRPGDERTVLVVAVEHTYPAMFGSDRYVERVNVPMIREDGSWKIDRPMVGYQQWWDEGEDKW